MGMSRAASPASAARCARGCSRAGYCPSSNTFPATAANVFDDGQYPALEQPLAHRAAEAGDAARLIPIGSVADHRIGTRDRKIEHRRTIDGNPQTAEIIGDQSGAEPGGC